LRRVLALASSKERAQQLKKLRQSISSLRASLQLLEGQVRVTASDPILTSPVAGISKRKELKRLEASLRSKQGQFRSENELLEVFAAQDEVQGELCRAATSGDLCAFDTLIHKGASVNAPDDLGFSALHYACAHGRMRIVAAAIENGGDLGEREEGSHPLTLAAARGKLQVVSELLARGADVNSIDGDSLTALHVAAAGGTPSHLGIMRILVHEGAFVDQVDRFGCTALFHAVKKVQQSKKNLESVKLLIDAGADATWRDLNGKTALQLLLAPEVAIPGGKAKKYSNAEEAELIVDDKHTLAELRRLLLLAQKQKSGMTSIDGVDETTAGRYNSDIPSAPVFVVANVELSSAQQRAFLLQQQKQTKKEKQRKINK
jgi:hypothetical protein